MKADLLQVRMSKDFKDKLKAVADSRGITMSAYVVDRLQEHIRADLSDLRELLKQEDEYRAIAA